MKYILLEVWARQHKITPMDAKNWARRGKLKGAKKRCVTMYRWVVPEDLVPSAIKTPR